MLLSVSSSARSFLHVADVVVDHVLRDSDDVDVAANSRHVILESVHISFGIVDVANLPRGLLEVHHVFAVPPEHSVFFFLGNWVLAPDHPETVSGAQDICSMLSQAFLGLESLQQHEGFLLWRLELQHVGERNDEEGYVDHTPEGAEDPDTPSGLAFGVDLSVSYRGHCDEYVPDRCRVVVEVLT